MYISTPKHRESHEKLMYICTYVDNIGRSLLVHILCNRDHLQKTPPQHRQHKIIVA